MSLNLIYVVAFRGVEIFKTKNKSVALELCEKKRRMLYPWRKSCG